MAHACSHSFCISASSGLPVSYISSNPAIAFISHDTLKFAGFGPVTITARQVGDGSFYAADPVSRNLLVKSNITSILTREAEEELKAYPNPVSGLLFLESRGNIKSVTITGVEGSLLYVKSMINERNLKIDMSGFKPDCYILTIQSDEDYPPQVRKILKY